MVPVVRFAQLALVVVAFCSPVARANDPASATVASPKAPDPDAVRALAANAPRTERRADPESPLLGEHPFTLQWLETPRVGRAFVEDVDGVWLLRAFQRDRRGNFARLVGRIARVDARTFTVEGVLETKVHHLANGTLCRREGAFTFRITGKRKYWRLKEMSNPCAEQGIVDYVDVYFGKES